MRKKDLKRTIGIGVWSDFKSPSISAEELESDLRHDEEVSYSPKKVTLYDSDEACEIDSKLAEKIERFDDILNEMGETYMKKNLDYGDSFSDSIDKYGYVAGLVRISDKWNRINSLMSEDGVQRVKDESIIDTLTDMANYCIMLRMEFERRSK